MQWLSHRLKTGAQDPSGISELFRQDLNREKTPFRL